MKDYIERDKVLKDLLDQCKITGFGGLTPRDVKYVFSLQTNADVRPVVRCGECKWSDNYGLGLMCQKHSGITKNKLGEDIHFVEWHSKNFFCSDGERRKHE